MATVLRETWQLSAPHIARRILRPPARLLRRAVLPRVLPEAPPFATAPAMHAHIVGLLSSPTGIGKSARLCIEVLRRSGCKVSAENVAKLFSTDAGIACPGSEQSTFMPGGFCIYHLNPSMLLPGVIRSGLRRYYQSYNIGYWAWELERLPHEWVECIRYMHAIIVPSRFCQTTIQRYTSKPVLVVPHPVEEGRVVERHPADNAGSFHVVNIFRFGSSFERKNPIALVEAFRVAFGSSPRARLTLKTSDGPRFPADMARLQAAIAGQDNIAVIDEDWPEQRIASLMRSADVYASLHRSEGFGLPLAEAMMAGVPVIATNWSGNMDFCTPEHSFPVDCTLIPFRDTHGDYEQVRDAQWAAPSISHAAIQLQRVRDDIQAARAKAQSARIALRRHVETNGYRSALASLARRDPNTKTTARAS
jgi:glycosyltransferase involved in cell wall biosynthesis